MHEGVPVSSIMVHPWYFRSECCNVRAFIKILGQGVRSALTGEAAENIFQFSLGDVWLVHCHCDCLVGGTFGDKR